MTDNATGKYILDDAGNPVPEPDVLKWGKWFESANKVVARDIIGDVRVSTVFLGLDHSFGAGPPLLFETMIFDKEGEKAGMWRYATREEALKGHADAVAQVKEGSSTP